MSGEPAATVGRRLGSRDGRNAKVQSHFGQVWLKLRSHLGFRRLQFRELAWLWRAPILVRRFSLKTLTFDFEGSHGLCNPSIVRHGERWIVAARRPNYSLRKNGSYLVEDDVERLYSETYLIDCDESLRPSMPRRLELGQAHSRREWATNGFEDPRIFSLGASLFGLWSAMCLGPQKHAAAAVETNQTRQKTPVIIRPDWSATTNTMVVAEIRDDVLTEPVLLSSPHARMREKNWMPFVYQGRIHFLYSLFNMEVHLFENGVLRQIHCLDEPVAELADWSGSSQLIPWNAGWICVAHLAGRRLKRSMKRLGPFYFHRFVLVSQEWQVTALSAPFFIEKRGLEFCAGLAVHGDRVILSYGRDDRFSALVEMTRGQIDELLRPASSRVGSKLRS